ncbi:MAG TPA: hypothetical protein PL063_07960 [Candidatus Cloacimonadota bacterium]|nr:hypothetical protein [Candidatus Cloacimonadota bacterium]HQB41667.1 hypothetical protein [Candidatus Cloacimonadota bacterium]
MKQRETRDRIRLKEFLFNSDNKIITIAGLSKNAGKTSFLNYLIQSYPKPNNLAVTTTGHDGEDFDFLTGLSKPKIKLKAGNYFTCLSETLKKHRMSVKVIKRLNIDVLSKPLYLAQAVHDVETEIFGGAHKLEQIQLCKEIQLLGIEYIMIDGSLDRKGVALSPDISSIVIVASPVAKDIDSLKDELNRLVQLSTIKLYQLNNIDDEKFYYALNNELIKTNIHSFFKNENEILTILKQNPTLLYIPSAITDNVMKRFKDIFTQYTGKIIIKHPLHLMCTSNHFDILLKKDLYCLNNFPLTAIALNSYSVENNHIYANRLMEIIQESFSEIPIIDVQSLVFD